MIDRNCIHCDVCSMHYVNGSTIETCEKCEFRQHNVSNTNHQRIDVERLMEELEDIGTDMCEYCELSKEEPIRGYSQEAVREAIKSCQEPVEEVVGVCIEHPWAEEENGLLIPEYECPFCHAWHRESAVDTYCTQCGKKIKIVHTPREKR